MDAGERDAKLENVVLICSVNCSTNGRQRGKLPRGQQTFTELFTTNAVNLTVAALLTNQRS